MQGSSSILWVRKCGNLCDSCQFYGDKRLGPPWIYMVAVMAFMESPAIIMGLLMISWFNTEKEYTISKRSALMHSFTNGSVFLILGSLLIGYLADAKQAEGIKPFTNDIFKGFLAVFFLDMGIISGRKLRSFSVREVFLFFAIIIPFLNGSVVAWLSQYITARFRQSIYFLSWLPVPLILLCLLH